jgi:hypothetical protein
MLALYFGSGTRNFHLVERHPDEDWDAKRRSALRFLDATNDREAAEIIRQKPFELWSGSNDFNDEFKLLFFRTSIEEYLALEERVKEERILREYARVVDAFERFNLALRFIGVEMLVDVGLESVARPDLRITTETVERALSEAETLIRSSGAPGALDRAHTTFHGYLRAVCIDAGLPFGADPSITDLFKTIRTQHPVLAASQTEEEIGNMVKGMSSIVDAINSVAQSEEHGACKRNVIGRP